MNRPSQLPSLSGALSAIVLSLVSLVSLAACTETPPQPSLPPTTQATDAKSAAPQAAPVASPTPSPCADKPAPSASAAPEKTEKSESELCEKEWPAAEKPSKEQSSQCASYWLRYGYGEGYDQDDLTLDPAHGGEVSTRFTAAQFLRMKEHVKKIARTKCDDVAKEPLLCRAIEYFGAEADCRFSLTDGARIADITPLFKKTLAGEKLKDKDLAPDGKAEGSYSPMTLWRLRNAIYARHGRAFANPDLKTFFYGPLPEALAGKWTLKESKDYSDKLLTDADKQNLELIKKYETAGKAGSK